MAEETKLKHLGIICDGNRRWARSRGLPVQEGHRRGIDKFELIIDNFKDTEVEFLSFFIFSTENWDRSDEEISFLMKKIRESIGKWYKQAQKDNLRFVIMGREERVEPDLWQELMELEEKTSSNTGLSVCICFNYGGLWEIADTAKKMTDAGVSEFTPESFAKYIYHPEVPACDLIVRTSGEQRISGFQLWRAAYSEFLFIDKHFPAIEDEDCAMMIEEFHSRQRRFGK